MWQMGIFKVVISDMYMLWMFYELEKKVKWLLVLDFIYFK